MTSCAPTVTNCPARLGQVTTEVITLYTTICPVTATETAAGVTSTTPISQPSTTQYTTSTVLATTVYTVTSCAPTVTNCPAKLGQVTTEVITLYTTVCPVEQAVTATFTPGGVFVASVSSIAANLTTTLSTTTTKYSTVRLVQSTATVYPVPVTTVISSVPYPTGPASKSQFGTGASSASPVFTKATSSVAGVVTSVQSAVPTQFVGAASSTRGMGVVMIVVLGTVLGLMI